MWQAAWNYFFRETLSNQKLETNKYVAEGKLPMEHEIQALLNSTE